MSDSEEKSTFHLEHERQGCAAILEENNWLSADELGRRIAVPAANPQAVTNQWLYEHCIFSISVEEGRCSLRTASTSIGSRFGHPLG
ncbi:hypothetical protein [Variovorax sp. E3]|uniref:hypothetical protein n=1 Tax=Variovorax sp. E3 TaxID=1914993 RepID=UPI0018DD5234|nr:hypothetical protein [Variovorax sp. E3]